jgi:hypothetical protein
MTRRTTGVIAMILSLSNIGCGDDAEHDGPLASDFDDYELLDSAEVCDPESVTFTTEIDNIYFPLPVGLQLILEGDDDGELVRVEISVLDETEEVAGVTTRVVEESEFEGGEQIEVSRNFYAQAEDGTVCYFGEDVDDYEDGEITGHSGEWRAGEDGAMPGIQMPGTPAVGVKFALENGPGVAEDMTAIAATGETVTTPAGEFTDTIRNVDWNPLEGPEGEIKYHAAGVGLIVDDAIELIDMTIP